MLHTGGVRLFSSFPGRVTGLSSRLALNPRALVSAGGLRWVTDGEGTAGDTATASREARPQGYRHPAAWVLPRVAGGLGAGRNRIVGEATLAGNLAGGRNAEASLTGSGTIDGAALALVVSAVAALTGSTSVVAAITGKLEAAASLTGSASLSAALGALAGLVASLSGDTTVAGSLSGVGSMASDVNATGDLTVGAIADAVWDEVLSGHLTSGSTGAALNGAGSAGDPWGTALPGSYGAGTAGNLVGTLLDAAISSRAAPGAAMTLTPAEREDVAEALLDLAGAVRGATVRQVLQRMAAVMTGKTSGFASGAGTRTVRSIDDTADELVVVQDANGNRTSVTPAP